MPVAIALSERAKVLLDHQRSLPEVLNSSVLPVEIKAAVAAALERGETHYTDRPGILRLREKIAELLHQRFGVQVDARRDVLVTCGITEARFLATQLLLQPGDVLAAPGSASSLFGAAVLRDARVMTEVRPEAKLIHLKSSTPELVMRSLLASLSRSALVLFEVDDAESGFHPTQLDGFEDRVITIGRLGEESWRIGYLASPGGRSPELREFKQSLTICSTNLSQWAILAAMEP